MADGSSGLSLSEMGISAVKKTAGVVKKVASPVGQQVKQQIIGGTFFPGQAQQLPSSQPPSETSPKQAGGFDINSILGEKNPFGTPNQKQTNPQMQNPQLTTQIEQQKAQDQQKVEALRKKLHELYFEEFNKKAEGRDKASQEQEQKRMKLEQEKDEEKKQQKEQLMAPIQMSEGQQKGMPGQKKKSGF